MWRPNFFFVFYFMLATLPIINAARTTTSSAVKSSSHAVRPSSSSRKALSSTAAHVSSTRARSSSSTHTTSIHTSSTRARVSSSTRTTTIHTSSTRARSSASTRSTATGLPVFHVRAGSSGTAADGQYLEGMQSDSSVPLLFNYGSPLSVQNFSIDPKSGYLRDGPDYIVVGLWYTGNQVHNPATLITIRPSNIQTTNMAPLVCQDAGQSLTCKLQSGKLAGNAIYKVFSLSMAQGQRYQALVIGTSVPTNHSHVTLKTVPI